MSDFKTKRDQAAEEYAEGIDDSWWENQAPPEIDKAGFKAGADWAWEIAQEEIGLTRKMAEALLATKDGETERLKDQIAVLEYRPPSERMKERDQARAEIERLKAAQFGPDIGSDGEIWACPETKAYKENGI